MRKLLALRSLSSTFGTFGKTFGKTFGLAHLMVGALVALSACTGDEGVTAKCVQDVNANGNQHLENGCNKFARCEINGEVRPAEDCCADLPEGPDRDACLYGYGAFDFPNENGTGGAGGAGGSGGGGS